MTMSARAPRSRYWYSSVALTLIVVAVLVSVAAICEWLIADMGAEAARNGHTLTEQCAWLVRIGWVSTVVVGLWMLWSAWRTPDR